MNAVTVGELIATECAAVSYVWISCTYQSVCLDWSILTDLLDRGFGVCEAGSKQFSCKVGG